MTQTRGHAALLLPLGADETLAARVRELEAERDEMRAQVAELQRAAEAGLLTGGLAHDLLNQLTALLGTAELSIQQGYPEALREGLRAAMRQGWRMHETVDAFLAFVRRREGRERVFAVSDAMDALGRLVEPVARAQCVEFMQTCSTRARLLADRQLVEQALVNLAMNGVRAASAVGGRVVVGATDGTDGFVRITVRDTGNGIREDVRRRLFQPFATGHRATGGTGLGLYVVQQVVQRCGGTVSVETGSAGTRFEVLLPAVSDPPAGV